MSSGRGRTDGESINRLSRKYRQADILRRYFFTRLPGSCFCQKIMMDGSKIWVNSVAFILYNSNIKIDRISGNNLISLGKINAKKE